MKVDAMRSSGSVIMGLLRLARPANIITAWADILAGYAAGSGAAAALPLVLVATTGLYGGGVVFNDLFDAELDAVERPERPIPQGVTSKSEAAIFGFALLAVGIAAAAQWSRASATTATAIAVAALLYDRIGKHWSVVGPVNMGLCRGLNFLLGVTAGGAIQPFHWLLAAVPLCYIAGITSISRGEVKGGTRTATVISATWLGTAIALYLAAATDLSRHNYWWILFAGALLFRVLGPFFAAFRSPQPAAIRKAVKRGILSLILLDASIAAIFAGPWYGMGVLLLYVPAALLAKLFAVT